MSGSSSAVRKTCSDFIQFIHIVTLDRHCDRWCDDVVDWLNLVVGDLWLNTVGGL